MVKTDIEAVMTKGIERRGAVVGVQFEDSIV
jgi:hypothetical protein